MNTFPAGTGEKMQYLVHRFNDNTIRFVLAYPEQVDAEKLRRAARAAVMGADILHSSFEPGVLRARWRCHEAVADDDFFRFLPTDGDPAQEAVRQALRPIAPQGRAQLRCTLVQGQASCAVAVCISHLCVDGSDAKYLLRKLAQAYATPDGLTLKNGCRDPEQLYRHLPQKALLGLMRSPATGIKSPYPFPTQQIGERRMAHLTIPADEMTSARLRAKADGATVNDLLLAACYAAYADEPGADAAAPLSVMSMMDLRRHCPTGDSEGLSNLSGALPTALPNGLPAGFHALLAEIARQTRQQKDDPLAGLVGMPLIHGAARAVPLSLLEKAAGRLYASVGIGLTNVGGLDCGELALDGLRPCAGWFAGPLKQKPHMQVSAASFDGACTLAVAGQFTQQDEAQLQLFLSRMAGYIETYAAS